MLSVEEIEDCFPEFEQKIDDGSGHTALIGVSPRWLHEFARAIECKYTVDQRDAERYRWMRSRGGFLSMTFGTPPEQFDAAVDAAMEEKKNV